MPFDLILKNPNFQATAKILHEEYTVTVQTLEAKILEVRTFQLQRFSVDAKKLEQKFAAQKKEQFNPFIVLELEDTAQRYQTLCDKFKQKILEAKTANISTPADLEESIQQSETTINGWLKEITAQKQKDADEDLTYDAKNAQYTDDKLDKTFKKAPKLAAKKTLPKLVIPSISPHKDLVDLEVWYFDTLLHLLVLMRDKYKLGMEFHANLVSILSEILKPNPTTHALFKLGMDVAENVILTAWFEQKKLFANKTKLQVLLELSVVNFSDAVAEQIAFNMAEFNKTALPVLNKPLAAFILEMQKVVNFEEIKVDQTLPLVSSIAAKRTAPAPLLTPVVERNHTARSNSVTQTNAWPETHTSIGSFVEKELNIRYRLDAIKRAKNKLPSESSAQLLDWAYNIYEPIHKTLCLILEIIQQFETLLRRRASQGSTFTETEGHSYSLHSMQLKFTTLLEKLSLVHDIEEVLKQFDDHLTNNVPASNFSELFQKLAYVLNNTLYPSIELSAFIKEFKKAQKELENLKLKLQARLDDPMSSRHSSVYSLVASSEISSPTSPRPFSVDEDALTKLLIAHRLSISSDEQSRHSVCDEGSLAAGFDALMLEQNEDHDQEETPETPTTPVARPRGGTLTPADKAALHRSWRIPDVSSVPPSSSTSGMSGP